MLQGKMKLLYLFFFALVAAVMAQHNPTGYPGGIRPGHRRLLNDPHELHGMLLIRELIDEILKRQTGVEPKPFRHEPGEDKAVNERIKTFMNRRRRLQPTPAPDEVPWDWLLYNDNNEVPLSQPYEDPDPTAIPPINGFEFGARRRRDAQHHAPGHH